MSGETIAYYIFKKLVRDVDLCTDMLFIKWKNSESIEHCSYFVSLWLRLLFILFTPFSVL